MTQTANNILYQALILTADSKRASMLLEILAKRNLRGTVAVTLKSAKMLLDRHHWNLIFLSTALVSEDVALEEIEDGLWSIFFYDKLLARYDERTRILI